MIEWTLVEYLSAFAKSFFLVIAAVLPIANPPSTAPIFLTLTEGASKQTRSLIAQRVWRNVTILMVCAALAGSFVLELFGISINIVRVGGGLLVVAIGWRLVNAENSGNAHKERIAENIQLERAKSISFYPLAFPIAIGPGSLAASITIGASMGASSIALRLVQVLGGICGFGMVGLLVYLCYRFAQDILDFLGETGSIVFMRLMAFILLCVGLQIIWDGLVPLIQSLMPPGLPHTPVVGA